MSPKLSRSFLGRKGMAFVGAAVCLSAVSIAQPNPTDRATTAQLVLWGYTVDYQNTPIPGINIDYEVAGTVSSTTKTGRDGSARFQGSEMGQIVRAEVDDADWYCPDGPAEGEIGGQPILFKVFHSKMSQMTRDERVAAQRARIRAIIRERRKAAQEGIPPPGEPTPTGESAHGITPAPTPTPKGQPPSIYDDPVWGYAANRYIIAFLAGLRYEVPQGYTGAGDTASSLTAQVDIPVIDGLGHPISDAAVDLLELKAGAGTRLDLFGVERTDDSGTAHFEGLKPTSWYRAECRTDDGRIGRSTVFKFAAGDTAKLKPMVVRSPDRSLSGFVLRSNGPARFARVRLVDSSGQTLLSTVADSMGYFVLGPLDSSSITLHVSHYDPSPVDLTIPIPADRETPEVLLQLDALARAQGPAPTPTKGS